MRIICQNTNGITNKIQTIPQADILILTETHQLNEDKEKILQIKQNYHKIVANGSQNSKGIIILHKPHLKISNIHKDNEGHFISINVDYEKETYQIIGIYLESNDNATTPFKNSINRLENVIQPNINKIIAGDFNMISNKKDVMNWTTTAKKLLNKYTKYLYPILATHTLKDLTLNKNTNTTEYTHFSTRNASRIDHAYASTNLIPSIRIETKYIGAFDHKALDMHITSKNNWGKGIWKLNTSLMQQEQHQKEIKDLITDMMTEKCFLNTPDLWEKMKEKIKRKFIEIGIRTKKAQNEKENKLKQELQIAQIYNNQDRIMSIDQEMRHIERTKLEGAIIRSRINKNYSQDQPSKYFYNLERHRQQNQNIQQLHDEEGNIIENKDEILQRIENYYQKLYTTTKPNDKNIIKVAQTLNHKKLSNEDKQACENFISEQEVKNAIQEMKNNKSPGNDGLPKEFYEVFWNELKYILPEVYNNIFLQGQMTESQRNAIIKLIYKKNDPNELKNWRPISLLNLDYKILSKILSNRLKPIMHKIIEDDQTCGIPGRSITNALDTLNHIWEITNDPKGHRGGLAYIVLDQEKAFDKIEHRLIYSILEELNFESNFIRWIKYYTPILPARSL